MHILRLLTASVNSSISIGSSIKELYLKDIWLDRQTDKQTLHVVNYFLHVESYINPV